MTKVYANEVGHLIIDGELVDLILTLKLLQRQNEMVYRAALKELSNQVREELGIDNLISLMIVDEVTVGVLVYNIMAGHNDVYIQGEDERGTYMAFGVEEVEEVECGDCLCSCLWEN
ncbi:hypothetical protein M5X00_26080 [Paenibacillus alvei]|uniref:hypothetical protein n=1 Tax=Paenibacillus alvei TaxID=44250 RepID=UPI000289E399|nr:hypothetical protein [Paenibacillus alvei]EJW13917.1 hypothetical protein PAV_141p00230 [Paenibacillus alvei DSM 29]MCY9544709.1 hypothetical protein [Paenibacillus alvei]MCY9707719.1 hypothetical protein [Paenibacillus alvei]MCY9757700.1 hypothetical protein [Paenibacillus alvei]MEC0082768.1 hypothetical protein [Paenibacillus alvei]